MPCQRWLIRSASNRGFIICRARDFNYEAVQRRRTTDYSACKCKRERERAGLCVWLNKTQRPLSLWLLWRTFHAQTSRRWLSRAPGVRVGFKFKYIQAQSVGSMCLRYTSIIKQRSTQQLHQNVNYGVTVKCILTVTLMAWNYSMYASMCFSVCTSTRRTRYLRVWHLALSSASGIQHELHFSRPSKTL
jgi:hypothetical protein